MCTVFVNTQRKECGTHAQWWPVLNYWDENGVGFWGDFYLLFKLLVYVVNFLQEAKVIFISKTIFIYLMVSTGKKKIKRGLSGKSLGLTNHVQPFWLVEGEVEGPRGQGTCSGSSSYFNRIQNLPEPQQSHHSNESKGGNLKLPVHLPCTPGASWCCVPVPILWTHCTFIN